MLLRAADGELKEKDLLGERGYWKLGDVARIVVRQDLLGFLSCHRCRLEIWISLGATQCFPSLIVLRFALWMDPYVF